jgi:hypothetical protein
VFGAILLSAACGDESDGATLDGAAASLGSVALVTTTVTPARPPGTAAPPDDADSIGLCSEIAYLTTPVLSDATEMQIADPIFRGVLHTYATEHRATFGGMWIDRDAGGTFVLAFTDDPIQHLAALAARSPLPTDEVGVTPRPPIVDARPIGEWGIAFDTVRVEFTEVELAGPVPAVMEAAQATGLPIDSVSPDIRRNRIGIGAGELTAAELDELAAAVAAEAPPAMTCIDALLVADHPAPIAPGSPIDVIPVPDADGGYSPDLPVSCLIGPGPFPLRSFLVRRPVDSHPELATTLAAELAGEGAFLPQEGWEVLHADDAAATVVHLADSGLSYVSFEAARVGWAWSGSGSNGECELRAALPEGLGAVTWTLDPAFPEPGPGATELHVLATELSCSSGRQLGDALLGPQVVETDAAVLIAFAAVPPAGGAQTCPGNPPAAVTIALSARLGERNVRDGLVVATYADLLAAD